LAASSGYPPEAIAGFDPTSGVVGQVLRAGDAALVLDPAADTHFIGTIPGVCAQVCVPILAGDRIVGALNAESTALGQFGPGDLELLELLAPQVAVSVQNSHLYRAAQTSQERFRLALEAAGMGTWECHFGSGRVTWSGDVEAVLHIPADAFPGTIQGFLDLVHPDDHAVLEQAVDTALRSGGDYSAEFRVVAPNGNLHWLAERGRVFEDANGHPIRILGTVLDITERKLAEDVLAHRALHDALTDVPNRVLFRDRFEQALLARRTGVAVAVLMIDLDGFKAVNDTHGHQSGDIALREVSARWGAALREGDTLARLGGDEFAVLLLERDGS